MRKAIKKKIATSEIHAHRITVIEGSPTFTKLEPLTVAGKVDKRKAIKAIQNKYGMEGQYTIGEIIVNENLYSISVDDFITIATKENLTEQTN